MHFITHYSQIPLCEYPPRIPNTVCVLPHGEVTKHARGVRADGGDGARRGQMEETYLTCFPLYLFPFLISFFI